MMNMKSTIVIGIISLLLLVLPTVLTTSVQADETYTLIYGGIIIGRYTTVERQSDAPLKITELTGHFLLIGPGWSDPPGYAQRMYGFFVEYCTSLPYSYIYFIGRCKNNHIFGLFI